MLGKCVFIFGLCTVVAQIKPMENPDLFEGDMVLTNDQKRHLKLGVMNPDIPLAATTDKHWGGVIPFEIDDKLLKHPKAVKAIHAAIDDYEKMTCIRFKKKTSEITGFIKFVYEGGCWSYIGKMGKDEKPNYNKISLSSGCWNKGAAIHEIAHALGFYHEQSRPDRDDYVTIKWENIYIGNQFNFLKQKSDHIDSLNVPYDLKSIMHYGKKFFSQNGKITIETKDPKMQNVIGRRSGFSELDVIQMNLLYKCSGVTSQPSTKTQKKITTMFQQTTSEPVTDPVKTSLPGCMDLISNCLGIKSFCIHSSGSFWGQYMRENCKETCGLCNNK